MSMVVSTALKFNIYSMSLLDPAAVPTLNGPPKLSRLQRKKLPYNRVTFDLDWQKRITLERRTPGPKAEYQCCVQACPSSGPIQKDPPLSFFKFPANRKLKNAWIEFSRIDPKSVTTATRVCSRHFEADQFEKIQPRLTLMPEAVPTVLVPPDFKIDHSDILEDDLEIFKPPKVAKLDQPTKLKLQKPVLIRKPATSSIGSPNVPTSASQSTPFTNPAPRLKITSTKSISATEFASSTGPSVKKIVFGLSTEGHSSETTSALIGLDATGNSTLTSTKTSGNQKPVTIKKVASSIVTPTTGQTKPLRPALVPAATTNVPASPVDLPMDPTLALPEKMGFKDIAEAFRLKAVNPWTYLDLEEEIKLCRPEVSKECDIIVIGTCISFNKKTGEVKVLSHGEDLNPRCFSPNDFSWDSDLLRPNRENVLNFIDAVMKKSAVNWSPYDLLNLSRETIRKVFEKSEQLEDEQSEEENVNELEWERIRKCDNVLNLIEHQLKSVTNTFRWMPEVVSLAKKIRAVSDEAYEFFRETKLLLLPPEKHLAQPGWKRKPLSKVFTEDNKEVFARRSKAEFLRQVEGVRIGSLRPKRRKEFQELQKQQAVSIQQPAEQLDLPVQKQQELAKEVKKKLEEEQQKIRSTIKSEIRVVVGLSKRGVELEAIKKSVRQLTEDQIKKIVIHKNSSDVIDDNLVTELYNSLFPISTTPVKVIVKAVAPGTPISKTTTGVGFSLAQVRPTLVRARPPFEPKAASMTASILASGARPSTSQTWITTQSTTPPTPQPSVIVSAASLARPATTPQMITLKSAQPTLTPSSVPRAVPVQVASTTRSSMVAAISGPSASSVPTGASSRPIKFMPKGMVVVRKTEQSPHKMPMPDLDDDSDGEIDFLARLTKDLF